LIDYIYGQVWSDGYDALGYIPVANKQIASWLFCSHMLDQVSLKVWIEPEQT
jgi:hypothetical protein